MSAGEARSTAHTDSWAEERVRKLAVLFGIPDGARYLNDCIEVAKVHQGWKRERDDLRAEVGRLRLKLREEHRYV